MTSPIGARINVDALDLDRIETREIVVPDTSPQMVLSTTRFGWFDDLSIVASNPDRLEAFAESLLSAARDLRVVLGDPAVDELDAFPREAA